MSGGSHLPLSRIKTIMKSSADVNIVSKESSLIMARGVELFIKNLAKEVEEDVKKTPGNKKLDYKNVANVVNSTERYEFLQEIIPHKITVAQFRKMARSSSEDSDASDKED